VTEKLCVFCVHLSYNDDGYGEYAEPASLSCGKGRTLNGKNLWQSVYDIEDFRRMILTAKDCPDYEQAKL